METTGKVGMSISVGNAQTLASGTASYGTTWWPFGPAYVPYYEPYVSWPWYVPVTPTECAGDVHVFPCPHCAKCKCGKAAKVSG
jgi:hypothetical protein